MSIDGGVSLPAAPLLLTMFAIVVVMFHAGELLHSPLPSEYSFEFVQPTVYSILVQVFILWVTDQVSIRLSCTYGTFPTPKRILFCINFLSFSLIVPSFVLLVSIPVFFKEHDVFHPIALSCISYFLSFVFVKLVIELYVLGTHENEANDFSLIFSLTLDLLCILLPMLLSRFASLSVYFSLSIGVYMFDAGVRIARMLTVSPRKYHWLCALETLSPAVLKLFSGPFTLFTMYSEYLAVTTSHLIPIFIIATFHALSHTKDWAVSTVMLTVFILMGGQVTKDNK